MPTLKLLLRLDSPSGFFGYVEVSKKLAELIAKRRDEFETAKKAQEQEMKGAPAIPEPFELFYPDRLFRVLPEKPAIRFFRPREYPRFQEDGFAFLREDLDLSMFQEIPIFSAQLVLRESGIHWIFLDGEIGEVSETTELDYAVIMGALKDPTKSTLDKKALVELYDEQQERLEQEVEEQEEESAEVVAA